MYPSQTEHSANFGIREQKKKTIAWKFSGGKNPIKQVYASLQTLV